MKDRRGKEIQPDDILQMSGCYFPRNDGKYVVLQCGDVLQIQRIDRSTRTEFSLPRAIVLQYVNRDQVNDTMEIIGKVGTAAG